MPSRRIVRRQALVLTALLAAAPVAIMAVLAVNGRLNLLEAIGAGFAAAGAIFIVVRLMLGRYQGIAEYLDAVAQQRAAPLPQVELGVVGSLQSSLAATAQRLGETQAEREQRLKSELAAVRELLSAVPAPLAMIDRQQKVVEANAAAEAVLGRNAVGRPFTHGLRDPNLSDAIAAALEARAEREIELVLKVPVERSFRVSVKPLRTEAANGAAAIVLLLDQTDAKRVDRMRVDFVANVSHELRTPLTSLIGFIESLRGPARDDAEARERFLKIMDEQATRMARLVADLMSLARIELEEHQAPTSCVDIEQVVRRTVEALKPVAARKSIAVEIDVPMPPVALSVLGDDDQLVQVVQNLVDNAVKYGKPGGIVRVQLARERDDATKRDMIAMAVADQGDGIEPHHLARLTERFYRVDSARSRDLGGTGLGLAIVKHIVNRHQGVLKINSAVGQGSQFVVRLPAAPAA